MPKGSRFKGETCHGIRIILTDRQTLDSPALGIEIASALQKLYSQKFQLDKTLSLIGRRQILQAIRGGQNPKSIIQMWQGPSEDFRKLRSKYLIY